MGFGIGCNLGFGGVWDFGWHLGLDAVWHLMGFGIGWDLGWDRV